MQIANGTAAENKLGEVRLGVAAPTGQPGPQGGPQAGQGVADSRGWAFGANAENGRWYRPAQTGSARGEAELEKLKEDRKNQLKGLSDAQKVEGLAEGKPGPGGGPGFTKAGNGTLALGGQTIVADIDGDDKTAAGPSGERLKFQSNVTVSWRSKRTRRGTNFEDAREATRREYAGRENARNHPAQDRETRSGRTASPAAGSPGPQDHPQRCGQFRSRQLRQRSSR
ncbi:MAG: hypothetical protein QM767_01815 [Anaeromyxobacter sp.]